MKRYALIRHDRLTGQYVVTVERLPADQVDRLSPLVGKWFHTHGEANEHAHRLRSDLGVLDLSAVPPPETKEADT